PKVQRFHAVSGYSISAPEDGRAPTKLRLIHREFRCVWACIQKACVFSNIHEAFVSDSQNVNWPGPNLIRLRTTLLVVMILLIGGAQLFAHPLRLPSRC